MNNKISWSDSTWNPVVGCTRISPGCRGCYAARMAKRQAGMARAKRAKGQDPGRSAHYEKVEKWDGVELVPEALGDPLKWKKPRSIFVCSMSDLFHEDVSFEYIWRVLDVIGSCDHHVFQLLTKRPERALRLLSLYYNRYNGGRPYDNTHLGVTAEDQQRADERIPILLRIPAVQRFVSLEPLLGPIKLFEFGSPTWGKLPPSNWLHLAIVGGETGPGARPMHPAWPRSLRDQCAAAGVGFHFKSWGEWSPLGQLVGGWDAVPDGTPERWIDDAHFMKIKSHLLDGVAHRDAPK